MQNSPRCSEREQLDGWSYYQLIWEPLRGSRYQDGERNQTDVGNNLFNVVLCSQLPKS